MSAREAVRPPTASNVVLPRYGFYFELLRNHTRYNNKNFEFFF
jgi:hypothetical protein